MARDFIGIGIIGSGFARTTQIPGFLACEGARIVAIASGHRENAERVAREFKIPNVADSWRDIIARDDVDLVSVVTPPVTHMEMTLAALAAGKGVLCEKPTAMNAGESEKMLAAAREGAGLLAHIDHELRFLPARRRMREIIQGGVLGRIRHAKVLFRADSRATAERAWDWWSDAEKGGGVLGAIGSHAVDALQWLLGAQVAQVSCTLATHVAERPDTTTGEPRRVTTDDETNMLLSFAGNEIAEGATGTISLSVVEPGRSLHRVEVFGEKGALRVEGGALRHAQTGAGEWRPIEVEDAPLAPHMRDNEWSCGFTVFAREIVAALREGRSTVEGAATFDDGHRIQLVLDAARRAHETGCRAGV